MKIFAVTYNYGVSPEALNEVRPIHREWLSGLLEKETLLASGPMVDVPNSLLIFKAESLEDLGKLLDNDPFDIAGFIAERTITEWNPVFGPWS
jgi:uncharacterized protein YciI